MTMTHDYNYDLIVENSTPESLSAFKEALQEKRISQYISQTSHTPYHFASTYNDGGLFEATIEEELHDLALRFPSLKLSFVAEDLDDPSHGYEIQFSGDSYRREDKTAIWQETCPATPYNDRLRTQDIEYNRSIKIDELLKRVTQETDYDLLYAQKTALLNALETGIMPPKEAMEGLVNFLDSMGDLGEALGRFKYDDIDPEFPLRPDYAKRKVRIPPDAEPQKMYVLCEEYEDADAIREFKVLALSPDENELKKLLKAKIDKDEYGFIATKGIDYESEIHFKTSYDYGFVEYYILGQDVLSPEMIQAKLQTPVYSFTYHHPDNLKDVVKSVFDTICENNALSNIDTNHAAEAYLKDKNFIGQLKQVWWYGYTTIEKHLLPEVESTCFQLIDEVYEQNPNLFKDLGALVQLNSLEDRLADIETRTISKASKSTNKIDKDI